VEIIIIIVVVVFVVVLLLLPLRLIIIINIIRYLYTSLFYNLHTFKGCLQRQLLNKNTIAVTTKHVFIDHAHVASPWEHNDM